MDEISENIFDEELDKLFLAENSIHRRSYLNEYIIRSQIWNEEIQNMHYSNRNESSDLKDYNCWNIFTGQTSFMYSLTQVKEL